eukprot:COSAG02_NODE_1570_length_11893_cov_2.376717_4_plen_73_part_00
MISVNYGELWSVGQALLDKLVLIALQLTMKYEWFCRGAGASRTGAAFKRGGGAGLGLGAGGLGAKLLLQRSG